MVGMALCSLPSSLQAQTSANADRNPVFNNSGLKIPRFVSLASDKVFVRTGPALRYPIKWVFAKKGLPVEIVQEFDTWRKIRDLEGEEGWIHTSLLSGKHRAIVKSGDRGEDRTYLLRKPIAEGKKMAQLENNVIVAVESCSGAWCSVNSSGYKGWIERKSLWGVYETEELD